MAFPCKYSSSNSSKGSLWKGYISAQSTSLTDMKSAGLAEISGTSWFSSGEEKSGVETNGLRLALPHKYASLTGEDDKAKTVTIVASLIIGEIDAMTTEEWAISAAVPITGADMNSFLAAYQFKSFAIMGKCLDEIGMSEKMQDIVARASELGTLQTADVMITV